MHPACRRRCSTLRWAVVAGVALAGFAARRWTTVAAGGALVALAVADVAEHTFG
ncbi:MAG: hypothetical protein R2712_07085 [Vicinamibacterales bacterium]